MYPTLAQTATLQLETAYQVRKTRQCWYLRAVKINILRYKLHMRTC